MIWGELSGNPKLFPFESILFNRIVVVFCLGSSPNCCTDALSSALSNDGRRVPLRKLLRDSRPNLSFLSFSVFPSSTRTAEN